MKNKTIPVYLFLGFLEAGKTVFIQNTLDDKNFTAGDNILLLTCEEGVEEYDLSGIKRSKITLRTLDDISELNTDNLTKLAEESKADCIVLEYNGMWSINDLYSAMPDNWALYQSIFIADANTILAYNISYRGMVAEKLANSNVVIFNRLKSDAEREELHKLVRGVSRGTTIYYEKEGGSIEMDQIEDPLPFDIEADIINVEDRDFAIWFSDIMEDTKKYNGKTVSMKMLVTRQPNFPKGVFAVGRYMMTCCAADIQFVWIAANYKSDFKPQKKHWAVVTAKISVGHDKYRNIDYPMMDIISLEDTSAPAEEVATFY